MRKSLGELLKYKYILIGFYVILILIAILSVYRGVGGIPMHLRISLSQGEYVLGENSQPFPTVPEMVAYYTRHDLPVQNASHIKLLHPIARP